MKIKNKGLLPILTGLVALVASGTNVAPYSEAKAQDKKPQSSWVKLCDKATFRKAKKTSLYKKKSVLHTMSAWMVTLG